MKSPNLFDYEQELLDALIVELSDKDLQREGLYLASAAYKVQYALLGLSSLRTKTFGYSVLDPVEQNARNINIDEAFKLVRDSIKEDNIWKRLTYPQESVFGVSRALIREYEELKRNIDFNAANLEILLASPAAKFNLDNKAKMLINLAIASNLTPKNIKQNMIQTLCLDERDELNISEYVGRGGFNAIASSDSPEKAINGILVQVKFEGTDDAKRITAESLMPNLVAPNWVLL